MSLKFLTTFPLLCIISGAYSQTLIIGYSDKNEAILSADSRGMIMDMDGKSKITDVVCKIKRINGVYFAAAGGNTGILYETALEVFNKNIEFDIRVNTFKELAKKRIEDSLERMRTFNYNKFSYFFEGISHNDFIFIAIEKGVPRMGHFTCDLVSSLTQKVKTNTTMVVSPNESCVNCLAYGGEPVLAISYIQTNSNFYSIYGYYEGLKNLTQILENNKPNGKIGGYVDRIRLLADGSFQSDFKPNCSP